tara:strand:+ start:477 stop:1349 length:873 start_codon:yes stop_codon:yes gene_type:complete
MLKVAVFNGTEETLRDKILGRPFSFNLEKITYTEDYDEANWILGNLDYINCNNDYAKICQSNVFRKMPNKFVFWSMHDSPNFAYAEPYSKKFLSQPLMIGKDNRLSNVHATPLQMRHYELDLISDLDFIEECRNAKKVYDFVYVGQIGYASRQWLADIQLDKYDLDITSPIWGVKDTITRVNMLKDFCLRMAKSKYAFAPRGIGTSSFRLYQAMMVGTVPIVSGMTEYPFSNNVEWKDFCIINDKQTDLDFNSLTINTEYENMRQRGIQFWEDYVRIENCDKKLFESYLL